MERRNFIRTSQAALAGSMLINPASSFGSGFMLKKHELPL